MKQADSKLVLAGTLGVLRHEQAQKCQGLYALTLSIFSLDWSIPGGLRPSRARFRLTSPQIYPLKPYLCTHTLNSNPKLLQKSGTFHLSTHNHSV